MHDYMENIPVVVSCEANCVAHRRVTPIRAYYCGVTVYDIRLENLRSLVASFGSPRDLADHVGADEAHIKQILKGGTLPSGKRKNVGNDLARKLEDKCFLGEGWMDMPQKHEPEHPEELRLAADEQMLIALYRWAPPELRRAIRMVAELARKEVGARSNEHHQDSDAETPSRGKKGSK